MPGKKALKQKIIIIMFTVICIFILGGLVTYFWFKTANQSESNFYIGRWLRDPSSHVVLNTEALSQCDDAPFLIPSEGFIGLLWNDSAPPYNIFNRHTGIDIFGAGEPGTVPVYAAYDGYLSRDENWLSSVIIRHEDPLVAGRTIWTYYTHMGSRFGRDSYIVSDFPRGTEEQFVEQGTLIGYQGEYAGQSRWIAMHLHFSIVTSDDAGNFLNEAVMQNTLDPSPYFGLSLNYDDVGNERPVVCAEGFSDGM